VYAVQWQNGNEHFGLHKGSGFLEQVKICQLIKPNSVLTGIFSQALFDTVHTRSACIDTSHVVDY
jgi:hypothetical protein